MSFLWLIVWISVVLSLLAAAIRWRPMHAAWSNIDIYYYTLALVGVLLLFLSDTRDRSLVQAVDSRAFHTSRLDLLKRHPPAFEFPGFSAANIAEGALDLIAAKSLAENCRTDIQGIEACDAARIRADQINESFGVLEEPPTLPTPAEARSYAENFCNGVRALGIRLTSRNEDDPSIRRALRFALAHIESHPRPDMHQLNAMRVQIGIGGPTGSLRNSQAGFAITVLNAAAACPPDLPTEIAGAAERSWKRSFDTHTASLREAELALGRVRSVDAPEFGDDEHTFLSALLLGLWPFAVSLALCLKLARAIRDRNNR